MTLEICFHMQQKQKLQQFLHSLMVQDTKTKKNTATVSGQVFMASTRASSLATIKINVI